MRVLWLCNLVLPVLAGEFNIKKAVAGGWMTGMYAALVSDPGYTLGVCVPIIDEGRRKDGRLARVSYYSFLCDYNETSYKKKGEQLAQRFEEVVKDFEPHVIHIWGTEYLHSLAMVRTTQKLNMLDQTIVHIQGLVSECARHFLTGIPEQHIDRTSDGYATLRQEQHAFYLKGKNEEQLLKIVRNVAGRTVWDKTCTEGMNPNRIYYHCGEILRHSFYENEERWGRGYQPYSIFMSQGTYPIKGIHYMLEALALLSDSFPEVHLYIAGENIFEKKPLSPYAHFLWNKAKLLKVDDRITYIGMLSEEKMIEAYQSHHVYVLSSTVENSPNSLCEAMMIGIPVVASAVGGVPTIIRNENEGLLYPADEPDRLAEQIGRIFSQEMDVDEMSKCECDRIKEYNNVSHCVEDLKSIYRELCKDAD